MKTSRSLKFWLALSLVFSFALAAPSTATAGVDFVINELDSDTPGSDVAEFVEIYDGGVGNSSLTGYAIVFYNGSNDTSYLAFDLDGKTTDANGYFLLANPSLIPTPGATNLVFEPGAAGALQNGQDAVGLYLDDAANFPTGTAVTATNLVDAIVYDTADPDDPGLLTILLNANQPQVDENSAADQVNDSVMRCPNGAGGQRNTANYVAGTPTPQAANTPSCPPSGVTGACCLTNETCQVVTPAQCTTLGGSFEGFDQVCFPQRCGETGACCQPWGVCEIRTPDECTASAGVYQGNDTICTPDPCPAITGACCTGAGCAETTRAACTTAGKIFMGEGTDCSPNPCAPVYTGLRINELRVNQPGAETLEFFEIYNGSGVSRNLNGLTYIVLGDDLDTPQPASSGVVEVVVHLAGTVPAGGHFLVAEDNDSLGEPADIVASLNFEDGDDNWTHMLVSGFYGTNGQDLDTPDQPGGAGNCVLETTPWAAIVDRVALIRQSNAPGEPTTSECSYGSNGVPPNTIGPDEGFSVSHASRMPDGSTTSNAWVFAGEFDPAFGNDTPGETNALSTGACCRAFSCSIETPQDCEEVFEGTWLGRDTECGVDNVNCQGACCFCSDATPEYCEAYSCTFTSAGNCVTLGDGTGVFQGGGVPCTGEGSVDCSSCLTIDQARALFVSGGGVPVGVRLCDVRLSSKTDLVSAGVASFQLQDSSGADGQSAITVFGSDATIADQFGAVAEGDLIDVQGTLQNFNGLLELADSPIRVLALVHDYNVTEVIPPPIIVPGSNFVNGEPLAETRESEIVTLECVVFVDPPTANFVGATNYTVNAGTNDVTVVVATTGLDLVGTPIPTGICTITGIFSQNGAATTGYRLLPRKVADIDDSPANCGPTGVCCVGGGICRDDLTATLCAGEGGNFDGADASCPPTSPCLTADDVRINEIRMDQASTDFDEYFELRGPANTPLGSLTYIVIGDGTGGSGTIEMVRFLSGKKIPADGYYLGARTTYSLGGTPDDSSNFIDFENDDNMTHMLVEDFTGTNGQDLDTPDDGILDTTPWSRILDSVAVVKQLNPDPFVDGNEYYYSATTVGPAGSVSPFHVLRCPPSDVWVPGTEETNTNGGNDTPGAVNPNVCPCACPADRNNDGKINGLDAQNFAKILLGTLSDSCADMNQDGVISTLDIDPFVLALLQGQTCLGDFATGVRVVTYNLLQYNGGASAARKAAFKRVMNSIRPDVLLAQEVNGVGGANDFLNNVLNAADGPGGYAIATYSGLGNDNACYYRTAKITYAGDPDHLSIPTTPRPSSRWKLGVVGGNPANDFYAYGTHLKAGRFDDDNTNPAQRDAAAVLIRADADTLAAGSQIIVAGDLNLYNANIDDTTPPDNNPPETAWDKLTGGAASVGRVADPIASIGIWAKNASFAAVHTQSPHSNNAAPASPAPPGAIGGGMDDRFDFMLINTNLQDAVGLSYLSATYKTFGNDALHFNNDINDAPTIPEGTIMADSLHMAADHLPVMMELKINP